MDNSSDFGKLINLNEIPKNESQDLDSVYIASRPIKGNFFQILVDTNSFYRSVMFAYIEQLICKGNETLKDFFDV